MAKPSIITALYFHVHHKQTKEEIERYTIDEQMDDAQKTLFLLK